MYETLLKNLEKIIKNNESVELVEIINSSGATPRGAGSFMYVDKNCKSYGTIGGGASEYDATKYAYSLLQKNKNATKKYNMKLDKDDTKNMICGGSCTMKFTYLSNNDKSIKKICELKEKNKNTSTVYIFGAGHISIELSKLLNYASFDYVVWDDRKEFAIKKNFKNAKKVICKSYEFINDELNITNDDYIVVVTHGHTGDYIVLKEVLRKNPYYVGCIGSKTKNEIVNSKMKVSGYSDKDLEKINSPIGLQVSAETPEEIAISIVCELILFRSKKENRKKFSQKRTLFHINKEYK